jgi:hypothetical protein
VSFVLNVVHAECRKQAHYADCHYAECRYAECRSAVKMACFVKKKKIILAQKAPDLK